MLSAGRCAVIWEVSSGLLHHSACGAKRLGASNGVGFGRVFAKCIWFLEIGFSSALGGRAMCVQKRASLATDMRDGK